MIPKVTIVGLGLIGGSLGMAIKRKYPARVIGLTRERPKAVQAVKMKAVDYASTNIKGIIQDADIIFICYPLHLIIPELRKILQFVKPGAIITDVGSSKERIVNDAEKIVPKGVFFVGGHPMAGSEKTGLDASTADLFKGKHYILTRTKNTNAAALKTLQKLISKIGASVIVLDPVTHDETVAGISHMPVAVAAALVDSIMGSGKFKEKMIELAATGFRDTTRISSGDPSLGTDMFTTNKKSVLKALASFKKSLSEIEKMIKAGDVDTIRSKLKQIKDFRDSIYG